MVKVSLNELIALYMKHITEERHLAGMKPLRIQQVPVLLPTSLEVERLLTACPQWLRRVVLVLIAHGVRVGEARAKAVAALDDFLGPGTDKKTDNRPTDPEGAGIAGAEEENKT